MEGLLSRQWSDRSFVLDVVSEDGGALEHADAELRRDCEVVLTAVRQDGGALEHADPALRRDRDFVLAAVRECGWALLYADDALRRDRDVVLAAVQQDGDALEHADAALRADREVVLAAVQQSGPALRHADPALRRDRGVVLAAVRQGGRSLRHALAYADDALRRDRGVVLAAVQQNGDALEHADPVLRRDRGVVLAAVRQSGWALKFAGAAVRRDRDVVLAAVQQCGGALRHADPALQRDRDIVLAAVQQEGQALTSADPALRGDRDVVLAAVQQHGLALQYADTAMRRDRDVVLAAVHQDGGALQHVDDALKLDRDFVAAVLLRRRTSALAWSWMAEMGGGEVDARVYTWAECEALAEDPERWETLGTRQTFETSNYRAIHEMYPGRGGDVMELWAAVVLFFGMLQEELGASADELSLIRDLFTSQAFAGRFPNVAAAAAWIWTLDRQVTGKELCRHLNEVIRRDKLDHVRAAMPLIKCLNGALVNRGPAMPGLWLSSLQAFRGTGMPADRMDFFGDVRNRCYRVGMFLSASESERKAREFAVRNANSEKLPVLFIVHFDPVRTCSHVNYLEDSTGVCGQDELLFPPYSAFTVLSAPALDADGCYHIELSAAPDYQDPALPDDLPLCKWH